MTLEVSPVERFQGLPEEYGPYERRFRDAAPLLFARSRTRRSATTTRPAPAP